jgi:hypothetical protein
MPDFAKCVTAKLKVGLGRACIGWGPCADVVDEYQAGCEYDVDDLDVTSRKGVLPLIASQELGDLVCCSHTS